ncbi:olfactory receptor 6M1-like [Spea bombifrons]|uniref:olfactory receptor 6M1-like n=1 Tax=Spea bombifrons TaxID=233779 RepID=UPI00234AB76F|nr:olfactory receptor 6M1-like [Spea bombifrons]
MFSFSEKNMSTVKEFNLLGFALPSSVVAVIFFVILLSYLLTMTGNVIILILYLIYQKIHSPMYFFICNLAIMDICYTNIIVPNLLSGLLTNNKTITVVGCLTQCFLYFLVGTFEFFLLSVMSFDRYLAICHPLRYSVIMNNRMCMQLVITSWIGSFFTIFIPTILILRLSFCFREINHFFCDVGPLLRNSCTDTTSLQLLSFIISTILFLFLMVAIASYAKIVRTIFKIRSKSGRQRAFSTCFSHGIVVTLFFGSCMFMYVKPVNNQVSDYDKRVAVLNTIVTPLLNPYIYSLRNQVVKDMLKCATGKQ